MNAARLFTAGGAGPQGCWMIQHVCRPGHRLLPVSTRTRAARRAESPAQRRSPARCWPAARDGALQRKLHAMELQYLRDLVGDLLAERDALREQCEEQARELFWADGRADMLQEALHMATEESGARLGLTRAGGLMVLQGGAA